MSKKVLVLSTSPRQGGNPDMLCDQFMLGAKEAGNQAEKIFLRACLKIKYTPINRFPYNGRTAHKEILSELQIAGIKVQGIGRMLKVLIFLSIYLVF